MRKPTKSDLKSRNYIIAYVVILLIIGGVFMWWQKYKYPLVNEKLRTALQEETNKLYSITYDSLYFDEVLGNAYLKNIHILPDTASLRNMPEADLPSVVLDVKINSIMVSGVKTLDALSGQNLVGDSLVIDQPQIILYTIRRINRQTKIESEATSVYDDILGKLNFIKAKYVFINEAQVKGIDFYTHLEMYALFNAKIKIDDLLIDSAHNESTDRVLFSKQAAFVADSFLTYNNNRRELLVKDINFSGVHKSLFFKEIDLNRFENDSSSAITLLKASQLSLHGINSNEIVKNKNIILDTILCEKILYYQPPKITVKAEGESEEPTDSSGFMHAYSINLKHLGFPDVDLIPTEKSTAELGKLSFEINDVKADEIQKVRDKPSKYIREVAISLSSMKLKSNDKHYDFNFKGINVNSFTRQLQINSFTINPYKNENAFAAAQHFQQDRYEVKMNNLVFKDIVMNDVMNQKLIASSLNIGGTNAKIYRDLTKPLEKKSKVGNYPSQMLQKLDVLINIKKCTLNNAYIEYKEKQENTDSTGIITFANANISISNVTNLPEAIKLNNEMNMAFEANVLNQIPIKGNFIFQLDSKEGKFKANGRIQGFDAQILNKVSIPMALIKIKSGQINSLDFNFTGNDTGAKGKFVMKYSDLKVDVLKRDKETNDIKKRGLITFFANVIVKNNNPDNGTLREFTPSYERNVNKSFFNLVWKTLFTGMKETAGMP